MIKISLVFYLTCNLIMLAGCDGNDNRIVLDSIIHRDNIVAPNKDVYLRVLPETIPECSIDIAEDAKSSLELFFLRDSTSEIPLFDKISTFELSTKLANPTDYYKLKIISPEKSFYPGWLWIKLHNNARSSTININKITYKGIASNYNNISVLSKTQYINAKFQGNLKNVLTQWAKSGVDVEALTKNKVVCDNIPFRVSTGDNSVNSYFCFDKPIAFYALHFLHGVAHSDAGRELGYYKVIYTNGKTERINLISGLNIHELTGRYGQGGSPAGSSDCPYAKIAWRRDKTNSAGNVSIYHMKWINRHPNIPIEKIEVYDTSNSSLALLAVTGERLTKANVVTTKIIPEQYIVHSGKDFRFTVLLSNNINKAVNRTEVIVLRQGTFGDVISKQTIKIPLTCLDTVAVKMHIDTKRLPFGVYSVKVGEEKIEFSVFNGSKLYYVMCIGANEATYRNLEKIKCYGFDVIYVQPKWKDIETKKGVYQFDELQTVLDSANEIGLKVLIGIQSWATSDYKGNYGIPKRIKGRMKSRTGKVVTDATIWDDEYVNGLCRLWKNVAERFKHHDALKGYVPTGPGNDHMLNFGGGIYRGREFFDYSDYAQRSWREYIKEDIPIPYSRSKTTAYVWRKFMEFRRDKVLDTWDRFCVSIREADKTGDIYLKQSGGWIVWGELQGSYFDGLLNLCKKWKGVLLKTGSEWTDQFLVTNGALARPMGVRSAAEMAILPPPKEAFYIGAFNMMAYGCEGAVYVIWDVGQPTANWTIFKPAWQKILNARPIYDNVCIVYSTYSSTALGLVTDRQVDDIRSNTMSWGYVCANNGILNAATTDRQINRNLSEYDIIIDANSPTHPAEYWRKLKGYVERGGTLILPFKTGQAEGYGFLKNWLEVIPIRDKFSSCKSCNKKIVLPALKNNIRGLRFESDKNKFTTLVKWNNDTPAIIEIRKGNGRVIWMGIPLVHRFFVSDYKKSIESILQYAGLKRHCKVFSPKVQPYLFYDEKAKKIFLLAYNSSSEPVQSMTMIRNSAFFAKDSKLVCTNMITGTHDTVTIVGETIKGSLTYQPLCPTIIKIGKSQ